MKSGQTASDSSRQGTTASSSVSPNRDPQTGLISGLTPPHDPDGYSFPTAAVEDYQRANEGAFGRMRISKNETRYVGESHWTAVLNSISDLKRELSEDEAEDDDGNVLEEDEDYHDSAPPGIANLLRSPARMSKAELITALPPRPEVDRLMYQWFNAADAFKPVIHPPTFQEEYTNFWKAPLQTPTMWLGLLYSMMSLSASIPYQQHPDPSSPAAQAMQADSLRFHQYAASAAVLADYTTPKKYTIECLTLYLAGLRSQNASVDIWHLLGMVIRLALRMGLHKDGSHFPEISAFDQEMRRRQWHNMFMLDVLISFQLGLPSIIRSIASDTRKPGNFMDSDISSRTKSLPPSRPPHELTPMTYAIAKVDICKAFADAYDLSQAATLPSREQVVRIDNELECAKESLPAQIQIRPFHQYIADKPETIMWSFNIRLLYLKAKAVLHRPFMASRKTDPFSLASRQSCVDAAMQTLGHHHEVYVASQSGGQLEFARQYMGSISTHDYLLAAMILCLELSHQCDEASQADGTILPDTKRQQLVDLLKKTRQIWSHDESAEQRKPSFAQGTYQEQSVVNETRKAARALDAMVARAETMLSPRGNTTTTTSSNTTSSHQSISPFDPPTVQQPDLAFMGPNWKLSAWNVNAPNVEDAASSTIDIVNLPDDQFDWGVFDNTFTGVSNITDEAGWTFDPAMMPELMGDNFIWSNGAHIC
ncbi:fungal specific transcription factor domain-containing protein 77 [Elsinoe australis]|uniref:Fungal specific transcription factor domain-containing protein 77 n=1 Tax=Elsinoe australis TaxID=40998 RepID=A0A4U7AQ24_9PEZI|nr:fungal specific transcription factor domain-containing protein 77 [Elsinoe australis]